MERRVFLGILLMIGILALLFGILVFKGTQSTITGAVVQEAPKECRYTGGPSIDSEWREMKCSFAKPPSCDNWDFCAPK